MSNLFELVENKTQTVVGTFGTRAGAEWAQFHSVRMPHEYSIRTRPARTLPYVPAIPASFYADELGGAR
jgi:hypothetical protein